MELSVVYSRALAGIEAPLVRVETHLSNGLPAFSIVGLPETAVRESRDRVRSALLNSHFTFPDRRITVNLAPADLPKEGGRFDLPIALGILSASGQLPAEQLARHEFQAELALDGSLRPVPGAIPAAIAATHSKRRLVVAAESAPQAALAPGSQVIGATDLLTLCAHLNGGCPLSPCPPGPARKARHYPDLGDIVGQEGGRRALEVAASGNHNLLFCGPPGTGKTLLASRLPGILPPPDPDEALTLLALRHYHDPLAGGNDQQRPFRSPHHSASAAALTGGGSRPRPGEISLAHGGVLFLDELPEFNRHSLEALREPMEAGEITLSRARHSTRYPARFQLVAAMNPCPCGYLGDTERACRCTPQQVQRYRARISGPLLDRIDLHVAVYRLPAAELLGPQGAGEDSATVRARVCASRALQLARQGCANAQLPADRLAQVCQLADATKDQLAKAASRMTLSPRALHRTLRVARTIADLAQSPTVANSHLSEALAYRAEEPPP
ncbi:MAG: YifB family Mg chelatase-like AAA ATPase [Pseudomonadales bacterium]|nr:YifB family Mg chelatase-like AAA ATPase [Pseudomonadales bacterium]